MTEMITWIPVEDERKPDANQRVLLRLELVNGATYVGEGWLGKDDGRWYRYQSMLPVDRMFMGNVTHWAEMPKGALSPANAGALPEGEPLEDVGASVARPNEGGQENMFGGGKEQ